MAQHNFNVGDVVVNIRDLSLWDNVYHSEKALNSIVIRRTVMVADERRFALEEMNLYAFDNDDKLYSQRDGQSLNGWRTMFNLTQRSGDLKAHIDKLAAARFKECDDLDSSEIAKLEAEIAARQRKIDTIRAGKRPVSFQHTVIERDFIAARHAELIKAIS